MSAKSTPSTKPWTDPDDAPALTQADMARGTWQVGGQPVSASEGQALAQKALRGRPVGSVQAQHKRPTTLRLDEEVLQRWRASGKGWQTRAAELLAAHAPAGSSSVSSSE
jgi:uncharacterized protein (DUF4415 family)